MSTGRGVLTSQVQFRWVPIHEDLEVISQNSLPTYLNAPGRTRLTPLPPPSSPSSLLSSPSLSPFLSNPTLLFSSLLYFPPLLSSSPHLLCSVCSVQLVTSVTRC